MIELKRGQLIRSKIHWQDLALVVKVGSESSLIVNPLTDDPAKLRKIPEFWSLPDEFICHFFCDELNTNYYFPPRFDIQLNGILAGPPENEVVAVLNERSMMSLLVSISNVVNDPSRRIFICEDGGNPRQPGYWNDHDNMKEFINCFNRNGLRYTMQKYNMARNTVYRYKTHFSKILGLEVHNRIVHGYWKDPEHMKEFLNELEEYGSEYVQEKYLLTPASVKGYRNHFIRQLRPEQKRSRMVRNKSLFKDPELMVKFLECVYFNGYEFASEKYGIKAATAYAYKYDLTKRLKEMGYEDRIPF